MDLAIGGQDGRLEAVTGATQTEIDSIAAGGEEVAVDFVAELEWQAEEAGPGRR